MSRNHFIDLANEFCRLANLDDPASLAAGRAIEVDGIDFVLQYDEQYTPEHVLLYCDFGLPPEDRLVPAYEALLEANMLIYGDSSPSFMLGPDKRVTLGYQCRLPDIHAVALIGVMHNLAEQAKNWRADYFLETAQA